MPAPARPRGPLLLVALALLSTLAPFATDMYLPTFPEMAVELAVPASVIQLTLTAFFFGVAAGQLVLGPLSDRIGRKPPLIVGSAVCLAASIVAAMAPNAEVLLGARLVQGFTGAAGIVIARAIVADLYQGVQAARIFSLLALIGGAAPVIAPLVGGILAGPVGWRGTLWALGGMTLLMLVVAVVVIPETHGRETRTRTEEQAAGQRITMLDLLRRPGFTANALQMSFAFVVLMGYIAASPFVFQDIMGVDAFFSGVLFAVNSAGIFVGNAINVRLVERFGEHSMIRVGLTGFALGTILLSGLAILPLPRALIALPLLMLTVSVGFIFGNSVALALGHATEARGAGSAFIGAAQFTAGAAVAPLVGLGGPHTIVPLAIVVAFGSAACWACYGVSRRAGRARPSAA